MSLSSAEISPDDFIFMASGILLASRNSVEKAACEWDQCHREAERLSGWDPRDSDCSVNSELGRKLMSLFSSHSYREVFALSNIRCESIANHQFLHSFSSSDFNRCFLFLYVLSSIHQSSGFLPCDLIFKIMRLGNSCVCGHVNGNFSSFISFVAKLSRMIRIREFCKNSTNHHFSVLSWDHVPRQEIFYSIKFHRSPLESAVRMMGCHRCFLYSFDGSWTVLGAMHFLKAVLLEKESTWNSGWSMVISDQFEEISDDDQDL